MLKRLLLLTVLMASAVGCAAPPTATPEPVASAVYADVTHVIARQGANDAWTFTVTIRRPDAGPDAYCDGWDIVVPARDAQDPLVVKSDPSDAFTFAIPAPSLEDDLVGEHRGVAFLPIGTERVLVRAHDSVHGWGGSTVMVDLRAPAGPEDGLGYEVELHEGKA